MKKFCESDGFKDPLLTNFPHDDTREIECVFVLQDWWNSGQNREQKSAREEGEEWLACKPEERHPRSKINPGDATLYWLERSGLVSNYRKGKVLIMNAVPGLRPGKSSCGILSDDIHKLAFRYWADILSHIGLATKSPPLKVYLCGAWSGKPHKVELAQLITGKEIPGDCLLNKWLCWAGIKNDPKLFNFSNLVFIHLYHPAAPMWHRSKKHIKTLFHEHKVAHV